jgi:hypothetical protein
MIELRPVVRASLVLYAYRAVASTVVAYPMARALTAFGATMHADGDRVLFETGGFRLIEALRLGSTSLGAAAQSGALVAVITAVIGLVPLAVALAILADPDRPLGGAAKRAIEVFPIFLKLGIATVLVQGVICGAAAAVAPTLSGFAGVMVNEQARDVAVLFALVPAAVAVVGLGVWEDLARARAVMGERRAVDAALAGWDALVGHRAAALRIYLATAAAGCAAVAISAATVGVIDVSRPGAIRVLGVAMAHQATLCAVAGLRAIWLRFGLSRFGGGGPGGHGLTVDLNVAPGGAIPAEIEAHDPALEGT